MADTMIPYENGKVYGPYTREADNRKHVVIVFADGSRKTVSYPRYLMEIANGYYISEDFEVHHKDNDESNDVLENLEIVQKSDHRTIHGGTLEMWTCATCGVQFIVTPKQVSTRKSNIKRGKSKTGPFCSKSCSGKVNN